MKPGDRVHTHLDENGTIIQQYYLGIYDWYVKIDGVDGAIPYEVYRESELTVIPGVCPNFGLGITCPCPTCKQSQASLEKEY